MKKQDDFAMAAIQAVFAEGGGRLEVGEAVNGLVKAVAFMASLNPEMQNAKARKAFCSSLEKGAREHMKTVIEGGGAQAMMKAFGVHKPTVM